MDSPYQGEIVRLVLEKKTLERMNPEHIKAYQEYLPHLEVSPSMAAQHPNNCAVIERTADGVNVGACWYHLADGITCPRHGVVKRKKHAPAY